MNISPRLVNQVLDLACQFQQIPAPTFFEAERAAFLAACMQNEGLQDVSQDPAGNVYGRLPGSALASPLIVAAHLDSVFPRESDLTLVREEECISGPGIGDNALGLASLIGLARLLRSPRAQPRGDVWLVATVGEEGLGNLRGMRAVVDRFRSQPIAYLVVEGMGLGEIFHRALGVLRYRVTVTTPGGHSWTDFGQPSAIHEIAALITRLKSLPLPEDPRTTLNVGVISGGTSINTIASQAWFDLDLRSEKIDALEQLAGQVESLARGFQRKGVDVRCEEIGSRPAGSLSLVHPLVQRAVRVLKNLGIEPTPGIGSTDASLPLSRGYPAICIGLTRGGGAHTLQEHILTGPLKTGLAQLAQLASEAWG
jgi:acetylornithine deacetylase/succinyl-diaminopimelate desuccinylase-like protein